MPRWEKRGLIYCPDGVSSWAKAWVLTPTPVLLNERVIRIYASFRDENGAGRIGYIDVSAANPREVLSVSEHPVLDIGSPGMFDDNGMILGDVVSIGSEIRMYYVGFQIPAKVKFMAFSGMALSRDGGETFVRVSQVPIMDRADNASFIRAIHTVLYEGGRYKIWYSVGCGWQEINGIAYPKYNIRYTESDDGIHFPDREGSLCIDVGNNEYRIGRPRIWKEDGLYHMYFTYDTLDKRYAAGYASSADGVSWLRDDSRFPLQCSGSGWDSEMICYPVRLDAGGRRYIFYSGNNMGQTGVGFAELVAA